MLEPGIENPLKRFDGRRSILGVAVVASLDYTAAAVRWGQKRIRQMHCTLLR